MCIYIYNIYAHKYMHMFYYICLNTPNTSNDFHKGGLQNPYDHKTILLMMVLEKIKQRHSLTLL